MNNYLFFFLEYELIAEQKSCNGAYNSVTHFYSLSECADLCKESTSMFVFSRLDSGDLCTPERGCKCYCLTDTSNGMCTQGQTTSQYYDLYRFGELKRRSRNNLS